VTRRRYSEAKKAEVVGLATIEGQRGASQITGIPLTTIHGWYNAPRFEQLRTAKREEFEEALWVGVQVGLKAVVDAFDGEADLGRKSVAFGILYDKLALMRGDATSRTESRSITDDLNDNERQRLRDWIDALPIPAAGVEG
jgi:hypothetical protein